jgi:hypothetical protein
MNASERLLMPEFTDRHHPFYFTTALSTLIRLGIDLNRVELLAVGLHETYRGEVISQEPKAGTEIAPRTRIRLEVGLESAVDILPYQFFFGFESNRDSTGEWETAGRRLLAPFDSAIIRRRGWEDFRRLSFTLAQSDREQLLRFFELFEFDPKLVGESSRECSLWVALLPLFHYWAGNAALVAKMVTAIFGYPCEIIESARSTTAIPVGLQSRLGHNNCRLGSETILGETFSDIDSGYRVVISDVEPEKALGWLPGKPLFMKLKQLLAMCLPGHLEGEVVVRCRRSPFSTGAAQRTARLGYTTHV